MGYVYFARLYDDDIFKIGMTNRDPEKRVKAIQGKIRKTDSLAVVKLYGFFKTKNAKKDESYLHSYFYRERINIFGTAKEWFELDEGKVESVFNAVNLKCQYSLKIKLQLSDEYVEELKDRLRSDSEYYENDSVGRIIRIADQEFLDRLIKIRRNLKLTGTTPNKLRGFIRQ